MTTEDIVAAYVALRDKIAADKKAMEEALKPLQDGLESLEGLLLKELEKAGADSIKTKAGTAYKASWSSARVVDWSQTLDFIRESERFDLLERRVSKAVVEELGDVPGVAVERGTRVNVRRA